MAKTNKEKWFVKISRRPSLLDRNTLLNLFSITTHKKFERTELIGSAIPEIDKTYENISIDVSSWNVESSYQIVQDETHLYGVESGKTGYYLICLVEAVNPIVGIYESLSLELGDIENYSGNGEFTTYGKYLANYFTLASVFGSLISYKTGELKLSAIESEIGAKVLNDEITVDQISTYINQAFFLGSFSELAVPVYTKKALTTDPNVEIRRAELLKQYKDQLDDPIVCSKIEDELIKMDKAYLKGDPSMGFYGSSSRKFDVHRKRQFLTIGLLNEFSKEKGKYNFIEGALIDGWEKSAFPTLCNDIRSGSYDRGVQTAQGGEQTKYLLRIFQNLKIRSEDCGTKRGLPVTFTDENIKDFYGCNIILESGQLVTLSSRNASSYVNKSVKIRSTMYCEDKDGFCFTCTGDSYRHLDVKAIGATALELGSAFLMIAMKSMHGTKMSSFVVDDLDQYLV